MASACSLPPTSFSFLNHPTSSDHKCSRDDGDCKYCAQNDPKQESQKREQIRETLAKNGLDPTQFFKAIQVLTEIDHQTFALMTEVDQDRVVSASMRVDMRLKLLHLKHNSQQIDPEQISKKLQELSEASKKLSEELSQLREQLSATAAKLDVEKDYFSSLQELAKSPVKKKRQQAQEKLRIAQKNKSTLQTRCNEIHVELIKKERLFDEIQRKKAELEQSSKSDAELQHMAESCVSLRKKSSRLIAHSDLLTAGFQATCNQIIRDLGKDGKQRVIKDCLEILLA